MPLQVQVYVDSLVKKAYDNWDQVVEYDGKTLVSAKQNNRPDASEDELHMESIDYTSGLDHQLQLPVLPVSVPSEQQMNSGMPVGGKHYFLKLQFDLVSSGPGLLCLSNMISEYGFLIIMMKEVRCLQ